MKVRERVLGLRIAQAVVGAGRPRAALLKGPLLGVPETTHEWSKRQPKETCDNAASSISPAEMDEGLTALCLAAVQIDGASQKVASHLCGAGCETEAFDAVMKRSALMWASVDGRPGMVTNLLRSGCNPDTQNEDGWTALMHAAYVGNCAHLKALLEGAQLSTSESHVCADPSLVDNNSQTALIIAIVAHQLEAVQLLARHTNLDDVRSGFTPLMWAVNEGTPAIVTALLEAGASAATVDTVAGWSALHHAVANGSHDDTTSILEYQSHKQLEELREVN